MDHVVQDGQVLTKVIRGRLPARGAEEPPAADPRLVAEAACIGDSAEEYLKLDPKQRNMRRTIWIRRVRKAARDANLDPEQAASECKKAFADLDISKCKELLNPQPAESAEPAEEVDAFSDPVPHTIEEEDGTKLHPSAPDVPHPETDLSKRPGISVGAVRPLPPDLVGDRPPRTMVDLYARWPLGDDQDYFLRVERTKPKKYRGIDCAGFLGEIRCQVVKESDLQNWLGGAEYEITVYGPDPRGTVDANSNAISKALTAPIKLTIPGPPKLAPQAEGGAMSGGNSSVNPFGNVFGQGPTAGISDPIVGKAQVDLVGKLVSQQNDQQAATAKENASLSGTMFTLMNNTSQNQIAAVRDDARRREEASERRLQEEKQARLASEEKFAELEATLQEFTGRKGEDAETILKVMDRMGPNAEADSRRQDEHHRNQVDMLTRSHDEAMKTLRDRHSDELRRADERHKDSETYAQRRLDEERQTHNKREEELRRQLEAVQKSERETANQRVADLKESHEKELKALERAHGQMTTSLKESWETRQSVTEQTSKMEVTSVRERLEDAQSAAEVARAELAEASDPAKVMEKAQATAEALGFEKKDNDAPRTALERFATMAGAGFSQMASQVDWSKFGRGGGGASPQLPPRQQRQPARRRQPHPAAAQAAAHQQPQGAPQQSQQQRQQATGQEPRRRRRSANWASDGFSPPVAEAEVPEAPLGFQENPQSNTALAPEQQSAAPQQGSQTATVESESDMEIPSLLPPKFLKFFDEEAVLGFMQQVEMAVDGSMKPSDFATMFVSSYRDAAITMVSNFQTGEIIAALEAMPGSEESSTLRRDGRKWLSGLWAAIPKELENTSAVATTLEKSTAELEQAQPTG